MKSSQITVGILAHVDAGKTTLSECILYKTGSIRKMGRVDHKDAFLDTFAMERARGITIFSKQAVFPLGDFQVTLLDTPGHVDFSSETERTLQVLDYAILIINGADGVQGHTLTLWKLLKRYGIPTFIFVNKMDQIGTNREYLIEHIQKSLSENCIDFTPHQDPHELWDHLSMCHELLMNEYLETGSLAIESIGRSIFLRKIYPVFFGSALKVHGIESFLKGLETYMVPKEYPDEFGAKIYKITRDSLGNRLTHMKITGGSLRVKEVLTGLSTCNGQTESWREKVDQIRIYSGNQFRSETEVLAGTICTVTGLSIVRSGEGIGASTHTMPPLLKPVLNYQILLPPEVDLHGFLGKLRQIEEESPQLNVLWNELLREIHVQVMGEIELEILKHTIEERYQIGIEFGPGSLLYYETIAEPVIGIGHFEPLRHYAEVHLLLSPGEPGSGIQVDAACSEEMLGKNWQNLILSHIEEKKHRGVLTGADITDIKITLIAGRSHLKHTEGGDFRQATYRAIRQGLKRAKNILLEPIYEYRLELPVEMLGRAMSDIQRLQGSFLEPETEGELVILKGKAPVSTFQGYSREVIAYTKGRGRIQLNLSGYEPCHNAEEIIASAAYDSELDPDNPTGSIFCSHGSGYFVPWDQVEAHQHVTSRISTLAVPSLSIPVPFTTPSVPVKKDTISEEELEDIFFRTYGASKRDQYPAHQRVFDTERHKKDSSLTSEYHHHGTREIKNLDKYLLVDGYNIVFAWEELKRLAEIDLDVARLRLMDLLCNYQSLKDETVIVVFDAYKVAGNVGEMSDYHNIHVVFTKEAETADQYIERLVHQIGHKYDVTVATSDALEQMIILGRGAKRLSADGLKAELELVNREIKEKYLDKNEGIRYQPFKDTPFKKPEE